jgi:peptidase M28-like protein
MSFESKKSFCVAICASAIFLGVAGCKAKADNPQPAAKDAPFMSAVTTAPPAATQNPAAEAPAPEKTGGFDGKRAFDHVAKQVSFGPRPAGSPAIAQTQDYILSELKGYGCTAGVDSFIADTDTPAGRIPMKNILVKIPGDRPGVILLGTHYDTKRLENFVGADDAGSSTGVMLELARLLCTQRGRYGVWIAFFDGEEAVRPEWQDPDNCYGSREMAARFANSDDLTKIKAFLLADIVGTRTPHFKRETYSTKALVDLVWGVAKKLGYGSAFVDDSSAVEDDHQSFLKRHVPSVDVIDLDNGPGGDVYYWHTPQDSLDKISPKTLAIVGHVFLESIKQLQTK